MLLNCWMLIVSESDKLYWALVLEGAQHFWGFYFQEPHYFLMVKIQGRKNSSESAAWRDKTSIRIRLSYDPDVGIIRQRIENNMLSPNIKSGHARTNRQCKHKDEIKKKIKEKIKMKDWTSKTQREMKKSFYGLVSRVEIKWNHKNATLKQDKAERRF